MLAWRVFAAALCCAPLCAVGARLTQADIAELCVNADGAAHCGRLIETVQLKRCRASRAAG
jgi:hypothetical protein